jgi:PIN domain nuclease of toxin-antitoxin system
MRTRASNAILKALTDRRLFTSSICIWELTFASRKKHLPSRPDLGGKTPRRWFQDAVSEYALTVLTVTTDIASEAADIAPLYGSGDPGDCFLIATAHVHKLTLITRDTRILEFARTNPHYLSVIQC